MHETFLSYKALKKVVVHHDVHCDLKLSSRTNHDMLGRVLPTRKVERSKEP